MRKQRQTLSPHDPVAKAIAYLVNDWPGFTAFLSDGRIYLNNAAERELRSVARGRRARLFGLDRGGERAAVMYTMIDAARLNSIDPLARSPTSAPRSPTSLKGGCAASVGVETPT